MTRYTPLWLQAGSYPGGVDRRLVSAIWPAPVVSGCAVTVQTGTMTVNVAPGWVVVPTANNTGSVLCASDAVEVVTLTTAPASGQNRIDLVCCSVASTDIGTAAGDAFSFTHVDGVPGASPAVPAVPAGSVAIAQILVIGGAASIVSTNITDRRTPAAPRDTLHAKVYRNAAWTVPATGAVVPFDAVQRDPAGMWVPAQQGFVVPIAGVYLVSGALSAGGGAGNFVSYSFLQKSGGFASIGAHGSMGYGIGPALTAPVLAVAGDLIQMNAAATPAAAAQSGSSAFYMAIDYLGTG